MTVATSMDGVSAFGDQPAHRPFYQIMFAVANYFGQGVADIHARMHSK